MDRTIGTEDKIDAIALTCEECGNVVQKGWGFAFKAVSGQPIAEVRAPDNDVLKCLPCAIRHMTMIRRSLKVALFVGTTLVLLHQGDTFWSGTWSTTLYWKIPLTYCVPFLVATFGALTNIRR